MLKRLLFCGTALYIVCLAALGALLAQASPGPQSQPMLGLGIGSHNSDTGIAYVSGRRLACTPLPQPAAFDARCSVDLAGKPLTLLARRNAPPNPNQLGGVCEAIYDGQQWPCRIGSRHVGVHWFAYLDTPLGLTAAQLDTIRRHYPIENMPEQPFLQGIALVAAVSALLAAVCVTAWFWPRSRHKWAVLGASAASGIGACITSGIFAAVVTSSFWD